MKKRYLLFSLVVLLLLTASLVVSSFVRFGSSIIDENDMPAEELKGSKDYVEYLHMLRSNKVTGTIDPAEVREMKDYANKKRRTKSGAGLDLTFTEAGPSNFGGRTRAIVIDNDNPTTLYAGAVSGGVWKSLSDGSSWVQMTVEGTTSKVINVSCMDQAPNGNIYAGTGESWYGAEGVGLTGLIGSGIYVSTDRSDFLPITGTESWNFINELVIDQNNSRIYVATNDGLFYSDDNGGNWNLCKDSNGGNLNGNATEIALGSDGLAIASVNNLAYVSENGSSDGFVLQSTADVGKLPVNGVGRMEFGVAPSNSDVIYASVVTDIGLLYNIYKSIDKGKTWFVIGPGGSQDFRIFSYFDGISLVYEGLYNNTIKVDWNEDIIYVGGVDLWTGNKVVEDGFYAWEKISSFQFDPLSFLGFLYMHKGINSVVLHPTDSTKAYSTTDGGVFRLTAGSGFASINKLYNVAQYYTVSSSGKGEIIGGTQDNGTLFIDGQGNIPTEGTTIRGGDGGNCAISLINPEVYVITAPDAIVLRSVDNGDNLQGFFTSAMASLNSAYVTPIALWESILDENSTEMVDYVATMDYAAGETIQIRSNNNRYPFNYVTPSSVSKGDTLTVQDKVQTKFFFGSTTGVWMTKDVLDFADDPVWYEIGDFSDVVQCMSYSNDGDVLFVGTQAGTVIRISNIATFVDDTTNNLMVDTIKMFPNRVVTSIAVDNSDADNIVVTLGNYGNTMYIYNSDNALSASPSFTSIQGDLCVMPVYSSLIELNSSNRVMVGTECGLWSTDNLSGSSTSWTRETNSIPDVPVYMLYQQKTQLTDVYIPLIIGNDTTYQVYDGTTNYGVIYAATHGRGVFVCENFVGINDSDRPQANKNKSLKMYPNPAFSYASIDYSLEKTEDVRINVFDLHGRLVIGKDFMNQMPGTYTQTIDLAGLPKGTYIVRLLKGKEISTGKLIKH